MARVVLYKRGSCRSARFRTRAKARVKERHAENTFYSGAKGVLNAREVGTTRAMTSAESYMPAEGFQLCARQKRLHASSFVMRSRPMWEHVAGETSRTSIGSRDQPTLRFISTLRDHCQAS